MCPRPANRTSIWRRYAPLALILCLSAAPAFAQVPSETIRRIAQLKVEAQENQRLASTGQLDSRTYNLRRRAIDDEIKTLFKKLLNLSPEERREVDREIKNWTTNLAAGRQQESQPRAKEAGLPNQPRAAAVSDSLDADLRAAVEQRHRRILLQQRRLRGEISEAEFAAQDKKALGEIMAIRGKYARKSALDAQNFYRELEHKTWTDPENPPPPPAGSGDTSPADFQHDAGLAAKLMIERNERYKRYPASEAQAASEADKPLLVEWMRLREKWHAEGSGRQFDLEIGQRSGLRVMPMPSFTASTAPLVNPIQMPPSRAWRAAMQLITGLSILIPLGALYALYRLLPRRGKEPADRRSILWHAPVILAVWLWAGPVEYRPDQEAPYGLAVIDDRGVLAIGATFLLYLFYRRSRKKGAEPARLKSIFWFAPASVALWLWAAPVGFFPAQVAAGTATGRVLSALSLLWGVSLVGRIFRRAVPVERPRSTVYGTAHYAAMQTDIADEDCLSKGIFLGKSSAPEQAGAPLGAPGAPVCSAPEHHTLIVARTRTGKGTRVIVPTLLRYGGSALVIDPKGENAAITAAARRDQLGQTIHILNPWNALAGTYQRRGFTPATYNPLDILDRDDPNAVAIAQTLAAAICPAPPNSKETFWQGRAASVLAAVFLWLAYRPENKTLARAREIVSLTRKKFTDDYLLEMSVSDAFGGAVREMATPFIDLAQETYSGIMANLSESTKFLSDPQVKAATAQSSFAMDDLATGKTTLYVVIPMERMDTQRTWLRLVISAGMHIFKNPSAGIGPS